MSDPRLGPLDPELDALLDAERSALPSRAALDRVWTRVTRSMAVGGSAPSGRDSGSGGYASGRLRAYPKLPLLGAFAIGAATGALAHGLLTTRPAEGVVAHISRIETPVTTGASSLSPEAPRAPAHVPASSSSPEPSRDLPRIPSLHSAPLAVPTGTTVQNSSSQSLSLERAVLDKARAALSSGEGPRALALTDEHAARFPRAQLREEREAVAIQALVLSGRYAEARARAARFEESSPDSLFLPVVDATITSIP